MKKVLSIIITIVLFLPLWGQQTEPAKQQIKQDYLLRSKNQKTAGWVFLGGGTGLIVGGIIIGSSNSSNNTNGEIFSSEFETGAWMIVVGITADLISIPFFISSGNNARRAAMISINNQEIQLPKNVFVKRYQPSITIKLSL